MNRGEAVPELVGEAGGQLTQSRQCLLEPQLFLEFNDCGDIRKQADGGLQAAVGRAIGDTVTPR
jgi:hypothetical protein